MTRKPCGSLSLAAQVQPLARRAPGIAGRRAPTNGGQGLAPHSEHGVRADTALPCGSTHSLVPSHSALCRPPFTPALRISQRFLPWGFGALLGFACVRFVGFKLFWPLALVQRALLAINLAALRRFGGPAPLRGLRPSSRLGAPFWPSGLTLRSSGPAKGGPLTLAVRGMCLNN